MPAAPQLPQMSSQACQHDSLAHVLLEPDEGQEAQVDLADDFTGGGDHDRHPAAAQRWQAHGSNESRLQSELESASAGATVACFCRGVLGVSEPQQAACKMLWAAYTWQ